MKNFSSKLMGLYIYILCHMWFMVIVIVIERLWFYMII